MSTSNTSPELRDEFMAFAERLKAEFPGRDVSFEIQADVHGDGSCHVWYEVEFRDRRGERWWYLCDNLDDGIRILRERMDK